MKSQIVTDHIGYNHLKEKGLGLFSGYLKLLQMARFGRSAKNIGLHLAKNLDGHLQTTQKEAMELKAYHQKLERKCVELGLAENTNQKPSKS